MKFKKILLSMLLVFGFMPTVFAAAAAGSDGGRQAIEEESDGSATVDVGCQDDRIHSLECGVCRDDLESIDSDNGRIPDGVTVMLGCCKKFIHENCLRQWYEVGGNRSCPLGCGRDSHYEKFVSDGRVVLSCPPLAQVLFPVGLENREEIIATNTRSHHLFQEYIFQHVGSNLLLLNSWVNLLILNNSILKKALMFSELKMFILIGLLVKNSPGAITKAFGPIKKKMGSRMFSYFVHYHLVQYIGIVVSIFRNT